MESSYHAMSGLRILLPEMVSFTWKNYWILKKSFQNVLHVGSQLLKILDFQEASVTGYIIISSGFSL